MNKETKKKNLQGKKKMRMNYHVFMYLTTSRRLRLNLCFIKCEISKIVLGSDFVYIYKKKHHSPLRDRELARAVNIFLSIRFKWDSYKLYFNQKCPCPCTYHILPSHFRIGGKRTSNCVDYLLKYFSEMLFNHLE